MQNQNYILWGILALVVCFCRSAHGTDAAELASRLFMRITGTPLFLDDPRREDMERLISQGRYVEAAHIATNDDGFYNVTLKEWAMPMSNRDHDRYFELTDFITMIIGTVRDENDFREILTGDYYYIGDPDKLPGIPMDGNARDAKNYKYLEAHEINLRQNLKRISPQRSFWSDAAGVLTTHTWTYEHLSNGTGRRPVQFAIQEFLCATLPEIADTTLTDIYVRRDVDRTPGGSSKTYRGTCRGCHSGLDALSSAFAYVIYSGANGDLRTGNGGPIFIYNLNPTVYPDGKVVTNDSWVNLWEKNATLGFRGPQSGFGIRAFGELLANSRAFSACMTKKVFAQVCRREPSENDSDQIAALAAQFEARGYNLRLLFDNVSVQPNCLGR